MSRKRFIIIILSLLLLLLAHGLALIYRVQPAVSLWFPPSGMAIALTLWLGLPGVIITGISSVLMAPYWGVEGWAQLVGLTDMIEPLSAWFFYRYCFKSSLSFKTLRDALTFILSAPLIACGSSAIVGTISLNLLKKIATNSLGETIAHWWLGNALGAMTITPTLILGLTPILQRQGWLSPNSSIIDQPSTFWKSKELKLILFTSLCIAWLTVQQSQGSSFTLQQISLLNFIPIVWGAIRLGTTGGMFVATFTVIITLLDYLLAYPSALSLSSFPLEPQLLYTHKLTLLVQCSIGLIIGAAITEQANTQTRLALEQLKLTEYQTRAQLSENLIQLNHVLGETNRQLQKSEERFRASVENMLDCFAVCSAIRNSQGQIIDFCIDYINEAACKNNLMTREEQIGRGLCEILPGHRESGLFEDYCQVVTTGQPLVKDDLVYEDNYGQGQTYLKRAFDLRVASFEDGIVVTWRDVTVRRQAEEELFRRQQEFEALVENSPDIVARVDRQLRYVYVNRAQEKATGISVKNFIGKTPSELGVAKSHYQRWEASLQKVLNTGQQQIDEFSFPSPDGGLHYYQARLVPEFAEDGSVHSILVVTRDITNHKEIEAELQAKQHFIEQITHTVPGILYVYDLLEKRNVFVNRQIAESLGYTPETIQDMRETLFPQLMHPEDLARLPAQLERINALEDGQFIEFEFRMRHANGQWRWFGDRAIVFARTPQGLPRQILGVAQDISERKEVEIALTKANERFHLATAAVNSLIYDWDVLDNHVERTAAVTKLIGYLPEEIEPNHDWWFQQIHPEDQLQLPKNLEIVPTEENCYSIEYRVRHKQGHYVHVQDQGIIVKDNSGKIIRVVGSTRDISARKETQEALRQSEARFRRLVDSNIIGIFFGNLNGEISEANQAFLQILGYTHQDFLNHQIRWDTITPPEHLERTRQSVEESRLKGTFTPFEKEFLRKDGTRVWVEIGGAIFDETEDGVCYVLDISDRKQAEEALRESEERYRWLSEAVPTVLFTCLPDGATDYISQQFYDYTGITPERALGYGWISILHPEDQDRTIKHWRNCVENGMPYQIEYRFRRYDGQYRWFIGRGSPIYDNQGRIMRWFGVCNDIHDLKETQEALQRSEARFRRLVDSNLIGVVFIDFEGNIFDANDAFLQIVGYDRDEIHCVNWREITPIEYAYLDEQAIDSIRKTETSPTYEKEFLRKDGSRVPILQGIARLSPAQNECVCFVLDLTERKQAESQKQQLASLVENSTDFIGISTLEGRPIFLNRAGQQLVGLEPQDFANTQHILDYFDAQDKEFVKSSILPTLKKEGVWQGEFRFRHFVTGELIPVFYNIFTIREPKTGQPLAYATVTREISQQKRIEAQRADLLEREQAARQQAEATSRMKDEFLAIVSHELRSPLNAMLGWSRLLRTSNMSKATTERALEIIERNAQTQTQLIEDLLDISRIIRGKIRLYLRPIQLKRAIEAALDTVSPTASTKHIQLESSLDASLMVSGDFDRLQQIIWNLLSNGIKFTPQGGRVKIQLEQVPHPNDKNSPIAQIQVIDTGKGIEADFLPHVFDRFRQADGTTSRSHGGLGLGLAIVRNLVELHGGTVSVYSAGKEQGSCFTVHLPLLYDDHSNIKESEAIALTSDHSVIEGLKILVVDDEFYSREFLLTALTHYGATVIAAASSQEALKLLRQEKPDVLLSDIGMPVEDGYTLIEKIRALPEDQGGKIPAAALTAYVREEDRIKAITAGFQMHIPKPIDPMHLVKVIAQLVKKS